MDWPTELLRLHKQRLTQLVLVFQLDPILQHHFELLVYEAVGESVSAGTPLLEVLLMGCVLLDGPVDRHTGPALMLKYQ